MTNERDWLQEAKQRYQEGIAAGKTGDEHHARLAFDAARAAAAIAEADERDAVGQWLAEVVANARASGLMEGLDMVMPPFPGETMVRGGT